MHSVILKAHYDGKQIVLDEPYDLPVNAQLAVTLLSSTPSASDGQWLYLAKAGLAQAYSDDEPDYPTPIQAHERG